MWPGYIKNLVDIIRGILAGDSLSINVTLVGGAVGGQTVAQGTAGAQAWLVADAALTAANHTDLAALLAATVALARPTGSVAVTPSDSTDLTATASKGIWVGGTGDLSIKLTSDSVATTILAVPAGTFLPGSYKRVMAATTATSIVAFS